MILAWFFKEYFKALFSLWQYICKQCDVYLCIRLYDRSKALDISQNMYKCSNPKVLSHSRPGHGIFPSRSQQCMHYEMLAMDGLYCYKTRDPFHEWFFYCNSSSMTISSCSHSSWMEVIAMTFLCMARQSCRDMCKWYSDIIQRSYTITKLPSNLNYDLSWNGPQDWLNQTLPQALLVIIISFHLSLW